MKNIILLFSFLLLSSSVLGEPKSKKKQQTWEQSNLRKDPNAHVVFGMGRNIVEAQQKALANVPRALVGSMGGQAVDVPPYQILEQYVEYSKKEYYKVILFVKPNSSLTDEEKLRIGFNEERFKKRMEKELKND